MFTRSKTRALSLLLLITFLFVPITGAALNAGNIKDANLYKAPKNTITEIDLFTELSAKAELYNQNFDKIPAVVKGLVGSEEIAGKIKLENGKMLYVTLLTNDGKIEDFYAYDTPNDPKLKDVPSITVETDEKTVRKVIDSKDPFEEAIKFMKKGSLKVETESSFQNTVFWTLKEFDK
jgi:hypothetical protein